MELNQKRRKYQCHYNIGVHFT